MKNSRGNVPTVNIFDKTADDALKQRNVCFCAIGVFRYEPGPPSAVDGK